MLDRRTEPRLLCADVVELEWTDKSGRTRHCAANLEDISPSGLGLQVERSVPLLATVRILHEGAASLRCPVGPSSTSFE